MPEDQDPLFPATAWTPLPRPPGTPQPVAVDRVGPGEAAPPDRTLVRFTHHAPHARAVALQANGWWNPDPPRACDLDPVGDGWFTGTFAVPHDWCCSYGFLEHDGPGDPPWWTRGLKSPGVEVVPDRTSPRRHSAGRGGTRSLLDLMEDAPEPVGPQPAMHVGTSLNKNGGDGEDEPGWQWCILGRPAETAQTPLPLLVLTDAEAHHRLGTPGRLHAEVAAGRLPPLAVVLVDAGPQRSEQLGVPGAQARWIATTLVPALQDGTGDLPRPIDTDPCRTVVTGSSFGSLTALFALARAPRRIGTVIAQSTSLWRFPAGALLAPLTRAFAENPRIRLRLQAGHYEGDMPARSAALVDGLTEHGVDAALQVHSGGHDWAWWQPRMIDELALLLAARPDGGPPGR